MSQITIPQEQWGALVGAAVMQSITEESRAVLVKEAITYLITGNKAKGLYDKDEKSPLQIAFDIAVRQHAISVVREYLDTPETKSQIHGVIAEAVERAFLGENRERLVTKMADAITDGFKIDRY